MAEDEKLERVAAEICYHVFGPWDRMADREKEKARSAARAAIEAMRSDPIPVHPTSLASPGIKGVAYIPEVDEILSRQTSDSKPSGYGPHGSNEGGE